ncbi:MAG: hypothetical protein GY757_19035 [bacterium]|nr:hypothetical protein [bacterium]
MDDWKAVQELGYDEMKEFHIGRAVQLNFTPRPKGIVIQRKSPYGLCGPQYKIRWDNGDETPGFLSSSSLILL